MASSELEYMREEYLDLKEKLREFDGYKAKRNALEAIVRTNTNRSDKLEIQRMAAKQKADQSSYRLRQEKSYVLKKLFARESYNDIVEEWTLKNKADACELRGIETQLDLLREATDNARRGLEDMKRREEDRTFLENERKRVLAQIFTVTVRDPEEGRCTMERNLALHALEMRQRDQWSQEKALEMLISAGKILDIAVESLENAWVCNTKQVWRRRGRRRNAYADVTRMAVQHAKRQVDEAQTLVRQCDNLNPELSSAVDAENLGDFSGFRSSTMFDGYGAYFVRGSIKEALKTTRRSSALVKQLVEQQELKVSQAHADVKNAEEGVEATETALEKEQVRLIFM
ncbi:hypothetical protein NDN08_002094 [Rhodosorus marinus]|uniref:Uncharacterized protein n=1 Tax=Rhodosorus marinus TaxID=101924 RepID=A0AAV8UX24_9RHOD|nr:hypothetical protein NDN08_002094 [Rhodosorus marinus]